MTANPSKNTLLLLRQVETGKYLSVRLNKYFEAFIFVGVYCPFYWIGQRQNTND